MFLRLALSSLWSRKGSVMLTFLAITVSVFVLLGVEQIRQQAKNSFGNTVSGIDLIVGARTGDINLLLYSVFRLGNATNNISWKSYQDIAKDQNIAWTIPISLGDSHRGYRVMGTSGDYFTHFRFGKDKTLELSDGVPFSDLFDVVLGAEVARTLNYQLGDKLVLSHGVGSTSFSNHDDSPFRVAGILKSTGTPVDRTLHVSLEGIEAIHDGWQGGPESTTASTAINAQAKKELAPKTLTAFMLGLESKFDTFKLQRQINNYHGEPLLAILPGVTLTGLWQLMSAMENTLLLISLLVLLASLLGLAAMLLASIRERQREIAVMRVIGASPWFILSLIIAEAVLVALAATMTAILLLGMTIGLLANFLAERFSLFIEPDLFTPQSVLYIAVVIISTMFIALIPGVSAYRQAQHQQLV